MSLGPTLFSNLISAELSLGPAFGELMSSTWILGSLLCLALGWAGREHVLRRRARQQAERQHRLLSAQLEERQSESEQLARSLNDARLSQETLEGALEMSESATRAKHAFLANMSHEIRTPLNGVLGMSEVLLSGKLDPREQRDLLRAMQTSGQTLLYIIDDILSLSKLEAGRVELEHRTVDLWSLVEDLLESFARDAHEKKIALSANLAYAPRQVRIDSLRLRQVLANLVGNALKFTRRGEVMLLARRQGPDHLAFEVRDTGIGIAKDKQHELFQAFAQVDPSTPRQFGGTGLGLAICRRLVQLMDGDIKVQSEEGIGSAFYFNVSAETVPPGATDHPAPRLLGRHALVIDPSPWQRRNTAAMLVRQGLSVNAFGSGKEARSFDTDLLLVSRWAEDPGKVVRELGAGAACYLLSSIADPVGRRVAGELGFDGTLSLPAHRQRLLATLSPSPPGTEDSSEIGSHESEQLLSSRLPLRILVAEDNGVNQLVAEEILRVLGYRVEIAANGQEVLSRLGTADYDLIFMDMIMPELDGLETTRRIRSALPLARQPKIIALTAGVLAEQRDACREAGMDDFLSKPMQLDATRQAIERTVGSLVAEFTA